MNSRGRIAAGAEAGECRPARPEGRAGVAAAARAEGCLRALVAAVVVASGCQWPTPFGADVAAGDQDTTAKNLERLAARPLGGALTVAVVADSHAHFDELHDTVDALRRRDDVDLVVHLGDLSEAGLLVDYEQSKEELDRLRVPYVTAIGNHDALSHGKEIYRRMFGRYQYAFTAGDVRFIVANTSTVEFGGHATTEAWLRGELESAQGRAEVVLLSHDTPYALPFFEALAEDYQFSLAIHGHSHGWGYSREVAGDVLGVAANFTGDYGVIRFEPGGWELARCSGDSCTVWDPQ